MAKTADQGRLEQELNAIATHVEALQDEPKKTEAAAKILALRQEIAANRINANTLNSIQSLRSQVGMPTDITRPQAWMPQASVDQGATKWAKAPVAPTDAPIETRIKAEKEKIREAMKSLNPEAIEWSSKMLEEFLRLPLVDDWLRVGMRGFTGMLLLEDLQDANYKLAIDSDQRVSIVPLDATRTDDSHKAIGAELAQKITALLRSGSMHIDTLRTGMLYRAESFGSYARSMLASDGKVAGKQWDLATYQEGIGLGNFRLDPRDWRKIPEYQIAGYDLSCFPSQDKSGKVIEGKYDIRIDDSSANDTIITGVPQRLDLARFVASVSAVYGQKHLPSGGEIAYETLLKDLPNVSVKLNSEDYFRFLMEKKQSGQQLSPIEEMLGASSGMFASYGTLTQAVEQFPNLGRISTDAKKQAQAIAKWLTASSGGTDAKSASEKAEAGASGKSEKADGNSSSEAVSTTTGAIGGAIGQLGGTLGKVLGVAGSEGAKVVMDTFRSATKEGGMWGAAAAIGGLIYGVYKLGFWKSLGAFLGIGVLSGGMSGRLDDIPDRLEKAANRLWDIVGGSPQQGGADAQKPAEPPRVSAETNAEKTMWDRVVASPTIKSTLEKRGEQLQPYVEFIQKSLSGRTIGELIYNPDHAKSIFSNTLDFPETLLPLPSGIDTILLKRILRVYLGDVDKMAAADPDGTKTKENYKNSVLWIDEAKKISDEDWKKKTVKEVVWMIGPKFTS